MATKTDHKIVLTALDKTKSAFRSLNVSLKKIGGAVFSLKTGLTAAFGAAGLGFAIQQSLKATDTLAKTASRIGTTTDALSKLRFAADITGVTTQTLDMAMQRFTRRVSEAAQGSGEAVGALRELGLDAKELSALPLDQRMLVLADAFGDVSNQTDQLRLAFKLFDSEGTAVLNTLRLGRDEMNALFQEADRLGAVMSADAAAGVESANDSIAKMLTLLTGLRDQFVAALAPALTRLVDLMREGLVGAIEESNGSIRKFSETFAKQFLMGLANVIDGFADLIDTLQNIINIFVTAMNVVEEFTGLTRTAKVNFSAFREQIQSGADTVRGLADSIGQYNATATTTNETTEQQITIFQRLRVAMDQLQNSGDAVQDTFNKAVKQAFDGTTDAITDLITGTKSASEAFKNMANSIVRDLVRMAVQKYITDRIFGAFTSFISPSAGAPAPGRAMGGPVTRNKAYMVGERGPELFVPNGSGSIVPNGEGGGEAPVTVNINVSTGVQQTVRTEMMQLLPQITSATKSAVVDARRRGGSFAGAFGG